MCYNHSSLPVPCLGVCIILLCVSSANRSNRRKNNQNSPPIKHIYLTAVCPPGRPMAYFALGHVTLHRVSVSHFCLPSIGQGPFQVYVKSFLPSSSTEENWDPVRSSQHKAKVVAVCRIRQRGLRRAELVQTRSGSLLPMATIILFPGLWGSRDVPSGCAEVGGRGQEIFPLHFNQSTRLCPVVCIGIILKIAFRKRVELSAAKKRN